MVKKTCFGGMKKRRVIARAANVDASSFLKKASPALPGLLFPPSSPLPPFPLVSLPLLLLFFFPPFLLPPLPFPFYS